jgi:HK97 family phage portal protein
MGLFQRVLDAFRPQATLTPQTLEEMLRYMLDRDARSISGAHVTPRKSEGIPAVGTCVRILSSTMAHMPLVLMRQIKDRREPDTANPIYALLHDQPNEWQTAMQFRELMQRDIELTGNAYARKIMGVGGVTIELLRMHPNQIAVKQDERMRLTYEYTRNDGTRITLGREEVLHIAGMGDDGIVGRSPITVHRETMGDALTMQEHGSRFFSNGAKPLGVITSTAGISMSTESKEAFKTDLAAVHGGTANAHKPMLLPAGYDYKPVSISMIDAQYIEGRKFTRSEIFGIFGVPPHKGGDLEKATFSNIEHQALEFVIDAIVPRAVRWEQAIKRDLLGGDPKRYAKHNLNALLRGDAKSRNEALQIQRRNGVINANEWRELDDLNPRTDEGGRAYIVEANMAIDDGKLENGQKTAPKAP